MTHLTRALHLTLLITLLAAPAGAQTGTVRIIQTNAAGDNVHIIDPATQEVVDLILGIPMAHGVTSGPDGSALYFSNEVDHTLDIVPTKTLRVTKQIPLTGRLNNIAITPDGSKVYVAITREDAFVDVVHLDEEKVVKRIPTLGGVHNVFMTPDGRFVAAGMIGARTLTVIDTETDEPVWSLHFDGGVRPMAFEAKPDGATSRIFVQISNYHGFYVVDFDKRLLVEKVPMPELPFSQVDNDGLQGSPGHGLSSLPTALRSGRPASRTSTSTRGRFLISTTSGAWPSVITRTGSR